MVESIEKLKVAPPRVPCMLQSVPLLRRVSVKNRRRLSRYLSRLTSGRYSVTEASRGIDEEDDESSNSTQTNDTTNSAHVRVHRANEVLEIPNGSNPNTRSPNRHRTCSNRGEARDKSKSPIRTLNGVSEPIDITRMSPQKHCRHELSRASPHRHAFGSPKKFDRSPMHLSDSCSRGWDRSPMLHEKCLSMLPDVIEQDDVDGDAGSDCVSDLKAKRDDHVRDKLIFPDSGNHHEELKLSPSQIRAFPGRRPRVLSLKHKTSDYLSVNSTGDHSKYYTAYQPTSETSPFCTPSPVRTESTAL